MTDPSRDRSRENRQLRPHPSSVAEARRAVRAAFAGSSADPDLVDTAELCVSELVTNAVVHAGTDIDVVVQLHEGGARSRSATAAPTCRCHATTPAWPRPGAAC